MSKFVLVYHAPAAPADATPPTPEEGAQITAAWHAWAAEVGDRMVDFGNPLDGGVRVAPDGTVSSSTREVGGYSIVDVDDLDTAVALTEGHPHLGTPGAEIEVHPALPVPGM